MKSINKRSKQSPESNTNSSFVHTRGALNPSNIPCLTCPAKEATLGCRRQPKVASFAGHVTDHRKYRRWLSVLHPHALCNHGNYREKSKTGIDEKIDVMPAEVEFYTQPVSMEPMLPQSSRPEMAELTCEILRLSGQLNGQIPAQVNRQRIASLVREMNSYYSNLIEGHKTLPLEIEKALRQDYSDDDAKRANQHLARAHIEVENIMLKRLTAEPEFSIHSAEFLYWLHREFYARLPPEMQYGKDINGASYRIMPGVPRSFEVRVGNHVPPRCDSLPGFMERLRAFFSNPQILPTNQLVALAAAHHRLAWIHPFGDGNGRVTRLHSHAWLVRCKVNSSGLWTLSRGLARHKELYYQALSKADSRRLHDYDGRGNLSDKGLADFCLYFLRVMLDQIDFMSQLLQLNTLSTRIERHLQLDLLHLDDTARERLSRLLKTALCEGEIERGRVGTIVGLGSTAARKIIRLAIKEELLAAPTEKAPLSLVFSAKNLETYFPKLFQDLPVAGAA